MSLSPHEEAAAILNHYLSQFAQRSALRWTEANRADIERMTKLLSQDTVEPTDLIPPYAPPAQERTTVVLDRDPATADRDYQAWLARQRADTDADDAARRMLRRNGSGR